jgi:small subunit ribosomal protein S6
MVLLNEYEANIIIRSELDDAAVGTILDKVEAVITEAKGSILLRDDWGVRKLAYPIKRAVKGRYILLMFISPAAAIVEMERKMRIDDNIVRFLTVKTADAVDVPARIEAAAELRKAKAEETERRRQEAEARAAAELEALANSAAPAAQPAPAAPQ